MPVLRSPFGLKEFYGNVRNWLTDTAGDDVEQAAEDDGSARVQSILYDGSSQIRQKAETTGEADIVLEGKDSGGNIDPLRTNADQQLQVQLQGADEAGNSDSLRTDPARNLWVREAISISGTLSAAIPVAEGDLWNPAQSATVVWEVHFLVLNNDAGGASVTVSVGREPGSTGGLAAPDYWMFNEIIPYPGTSGWRGPFFIAGNDAVRGVASAADDASVVFRAYRRDQGA